MANSFNFSAASLKSIIEELEDLGIKIEELTVDQILEILSSAILHIGQCQEAWSRLIDLFRFIKNLTSFLAEKQLPHFVQLTRDCLDDKARGDRIVNCLKDQLYHMVVKTSTTAFSAKHLADTYHEISDEHFMPAIASLSTIYAMTDKSPELQSKKAALMNQCDRATKAIKEKVENAQRDTQTKIRKRARAIEDSMVRIIGEPEPEIKELAKKARQEVKNDPSYAAPQVHSIVTPALTAFMHEVAAAVPEGGFLKLIEPVASESP